MSVTCQNKPTLTLKRKGLEGLIGRAKMDENGRKGFRPSTWRLFTGLTLSRGVKSPDNQFSTISLSAVYGPKSLVQNF